MIFQVTTDGVCSPVPTESELSVAATTELMLSQADTMSVLNESSSLETRDLALIGIVSSSAMAVCMAILSVTQAIQEQTAQMKHAEEHVISVCL